MHPLWGPESGHQPTVKPLLGTTGRAEAAGLAKRPDCCKRLLPLQADSGVSSGTLRGAAVPDVAGDCLT
jgi:hypothetical protein